MAALDFNQTGRLPSRWPASTHQKGVNSANAATVAQWRPTARQSSNTDTAIAMTRMVGPLLILTSSWNPATAPSETQVSNAVDRLGSCCKSGTLAHANAASTVRSG